MIIRFFLLSADNYTFTVITKNFTNPLGLTLDDLWVREQSKVCILLYKVDLIQYYIRVMRIWMAIGQRFSIYLMVEPSFRNFGHYPVDMGLHDLLKSLRYVGLFFLSKLILLGEVPIFPISDKHLCRTWHGH